MQIIIFINQSLESSKPDHHHEHTTSTKNTNTLITFSVYIANVVSFLNSKQQYAFCFFQNRFPELSSLHRFASDHLPNWTHRCCLLHFNPLRPFGQSRNQKCQSGSFMSNLFMDLFILSRLSDIIV